MRILSKFGFVLRWIVTWRSFPIPCWIRAAFLLKERRFEEAALKYEKGLSSHPCHPAAASVRLSLSYCYSKTFKLKEAVDQLRNVTLQNPQHSMAVVKLARMELWLCRPREAAMTARRALDVFPPTPTLAALYLTACLDGEIRGAPLEEACEIARGQQQLFPQHRGVEIALARSKWIIEKSSEAKAHLQEICEEQNPPLEALLALGEILIYDGKTEEGRYFLRKALGQSPHHPKLQGLLAFSYMLDGPHFSPEFAEQLALSACRESQWKNAELMKILQQAYERGGKISEGALIEEKIACMEGDSFEDDMHSDQQAGPSGSYHNFD